jgi:DUF971 family protein
MSVPGYPEPIEVRHEKAARRLVLTWDDGHLSTYAIDYLRSWCPCAGCQGHDPVARYLDRHGEELVHLEAVGNYALAPTWQDGHNTGLFSWRLLRGLCPCEDCGGEKR